MSEEYERQRAILDRMPWKPNPARPGCLMRRRDWEEDGQRRTILDEDDRPNEER